MVLEDYLSATLAVVMVTTTVSDYNWEPRIVLCDVYLYYYAMLSCIVLQVNS